jgi:Holliday junction DNA helicase RuvA
LRDRDIATLQSVPRVGRKKAEQLVLDLADKLDDLQVSLPGGGPRPEGAGAEDAVRALVSLGYSTSDAERAVRQALDEGGRGQSATELIRAALSKIRG